MEKVALDASALIALIYQEKGHDIVEKYLSSAEISTVNFSEVAAYLIKKGIPSKEATALLQDLSLTVIDFNQTQSLQAGQLILTTSAKGLSLGDRACIAMAHERKRAALTADKAWSTLDLNIKVILIR
jgi:PIN domain nuclease of toxin-antitoxin system